MHDESQSLETRMKAQGQIGVVTIIIGMALLQILASLGLVVYFKRRNITPTEKYDCVAIHPWSHYTLVPLLTESPPSTPVPEEH
jgi:hypothetical protein